MGEPMPFRLKDFYTFDDTGIGLTKTNKKVDKYKIDRPPGLTKDAWYKHAYKIVKELNNILRNWEDRV